jgi:hypothetical protein
MGSSVKNTWSMTAVIDIPDDLYKKVTDRVASLGRRVPEVTVELYERWLVDDENAAVPTAAQPEDGHWLEDWFRSADEALSRAPAGPSARDLLMQDRNRLEKS